MPRCAKFSDHDFFYYHCMKKSASLSNPSANLWGSFKCTMGKSYIKQQKAGILLISFMKWCSLGAFQPFCSLLNQVFYPLCWRNYDWGEFYVVLVAESGKSKNRHWVSMLQIKTLSNILVWLILFSSKLCVSPNKVLSLPLIQKGEHTSMHFINVQISNPHGWNEKG